MISSYVRQGRHALRRWVRDPRTHQAARWIGHLLAGFCLSAASLGQNALPLVMGFVWACRGWDAVLAAAGGVAGYGLLWGQAGLPGILCTVLALPGVLLLGDKRISREQPLLIPAIGMLTVSAVGLGFQLLVGDTTSVPLHLCRVALGGAAPWLFVRALEDHGSLEIWLSGGLFTLGLAQLAPVSWLGLGFVAAGAVTAGGAFPWAAVVGMAMDLACVTPVPMTAVTVLAYLVRFLPRSPKWLSSTAPGLMGLVMMGLWNRWDPMILPGLFLGGALGNWFPGGQTQIRRGQTGAAQVRLEMAAGVLAQTQQLLLEVTPEEIDEKALVSRAVETACGSCSARKSCRDIRRMAQLPGILLHKPLLTVEEIPVRCRKGGRVLAQLHRAQEQLHTLQADRKRQREYRAAVVQQYRFLSGYLQALSDRLSHREIVRRAAYEPVVSVYGNRSRDANGDRCLQFAGVQNEYYIVLCDGMGTGMGAVQEGQTAADLLRRMLVCGFPPESALASLNSLCALRERAGAVTVDLVRVGLDRGRITLYKWGAAPSYLVSRRGTEKLGTATPPPGLDASQVREAVCQRTMHTDQLLVLVSDGLEEQQVLRCCREQTALTAEGLARELLESARHEDDATVVTIQLIPAKV